VFGRQTPLNPLLMTLAGVFRNRAGLHLKVPALRQ
jgi:hypothetical protein